MKLSVGQYKWFLETDPSMVPYLLRDDPSVVAAGLNDLAWQLSQDQYCTRNDVTGFLRLLEDHLSLQESLGELCDD